VQRRDTPNCPSALREDVHGAVAQRAWDYLPRQALQCAIGRGTACLDKRYNVPWTLQETYTVCAGYEWQRGRARPLGWAPPPSRGQYEGYRLWKVSTTAVFLRR
jgi:hypothetical protein